MCDRIRTKVIRVLANASGFAADAITDGQSLEKDLGLNSYMRGGLAPSFERIAQEDNPSAAVTKAECERLTAVKDAIELVRARAAM